MSEESRAIRSDNMHIFSGEDSERIRPLFDEMDRLRARVAELERQRDERLILPVKLCRDCDTALRMLIDGVTIAYCCPQCYAADDIQITAEKDAPVLGVETDPGTYEVTADTTSVAASGPRTNETRPDVEASAADEWGPDDIFDLPSLGKVVGEYVGVPKARHDAEQAVVEAAKTWRAWIATIHSDGGSMFIPEDELMLAVDALSTSQRDRQEASDGA